MIICYLKLNRFYFFLSQTNVLINSEFAASEFFGLELKIICLQNDNDRKIFSRVQRKKDKTYLLLMFCSAQLNKQHAILGKCLILSTTCYII